MGIARAALGLGAVLAMLTGPAHAGTHAEAVPSPGAPIIRRIHVPAPPPRGPALEERLAELARLVEAGSERSATALGALADELRSLRGEIEEARAEGAAARQGLSLLRAEVERTRTATDALGARIEEGHAERAETMEQALKFLAPPLEASPTPAPALLARPEAQQALPPAPAARPPRTHVVRPGDTLRAIAAQYGVPLKALIDHNRVSTPDLLVPGARLVVP